MRNVLMSAKCQKRTCANASGITTMGQKQKFETSGLLKQAARFEIRSF